MERLEENVFYTLEKAVKAYRQFAQRQLAAVNLDITLDQWLVLKTIAQEDGVKQQQIAAKVFKDVASVTRIVELLVSKKYLERKFLASDRRRQQLILTESGHEILSKVIPVSLSNRKAALRNVETSDIERLESILQSIIKNVNQSDL